jgi:hypothetical protein
LSLPWLESAFPRHALAQAEPAPKRLLIWTQPNGTVLDRWVPKAGVDEADFTLSEILGPLERHQADMVVVQNLMQYDGTGHQYVTSLTGYGYDDLGTPRYLSRGISLDQYVAQKVDGSTPIRSLELGVGQAEDGQGAVSWSAAGKSVIAEANPFKVYARLVGGGSSTVGDSAAALRLLSRRRSVIDTVLDPLSSLRNRLGTVDRATVDNYLESMRGVEREIGAFQTRLDSCPAPVVGADPSLPNQTPWWQEPANIPAVLTLQRKLTVMALACDLTRVVTLTLAGSSGGLRTFDYIDGVSSGLDWHVISHEVEKGIDQELTLIEKWHATQLALLVDDLKSAAGPGGESLLASTLLLTNNEYGGNGPVSYLPADPSSGERVNLTHAAKLMPYLIFGQCGGAIKTGRNLVLPMKDDTPQQRSQGEGLSHTRLLVSVLHALGYDDTSFGNPHHAEGVVPGLVT